MAARYPLDGSILRTPKLLHIVEAERLGNGGLPEGSRTGGLVKNTEDRGEPSVFFEQLGHDDGVQAGFGLLQQRCQLRKVVRLSG